jgi:hypothetical protein
VINARIGVRMMDIVLNATLDMRFIMEIVFFLLQLMAQVIASKIVRNAVQENTARKTLVKAKTQKVIANALKKNINARNAKSTIQIINVLKNKTMTIASNMNTSTKPLTKNTNLGFWGAKKSAPNANTNFISIAKTSVFPILTNANAQKRMGNVINVIRDTSQTNMAFVWKSKILSITVLNTSISIPMENITSTGLMDAQEFVTNVSRTMSGAGILRSVKGSIIYGGTKAHQSVNLPVRNPIRRKAVLRLKS